jgi:hypothetical protein
LHSACPNKDEPRRDLRRGHSFWGYCSLAATDPAGYLRQITPAKNPSPRASASVDSGRS